MNWRQRLGALIGGFDASQQRRRLRGFRATRAHVNALIAASEPDITARARWLVRNNEPMSYTRKRDLEHCT